VTPLVALSLSLSRICAALSFFCQSNFPAFDRQVLPATRLCNNYIHRNRGTFFCRRAVVQQCILLHAHAALVTALHFFPIVHYFKLFFLDHFARLKIGEITTSPTRAAVRRSRVQKEVAMLCVSILVSWSFLQEYGTCGQIHPSAILSSSLQSASISNCCRSLPFVLSGDVIDLPSTLASLSFFTQKPTEIPTHQF